MKDKLQTLEEMFEDSIKEHLCKHGNYHCQTCEIKLLLEVIEEYRTENKMLVDRLREISTTPIINATASELIDLIYSLRQIARGEQGKDEEA